MKARIIPYTLNFKQPAGTSRGILSTRPVWFLLLEDNGRQGIGECAPIAGLSDESPEFAYECLQRIAKSPLRYEKAELPSSVRFALEMALQDLRGNGVQQLYPSAFTRGEQGILMNGLVWLGELAFIRRQIQQKIHQGCRCIKLKIGALNFDDELTIIKEMRQQQGDHPLIIRVDANGAFSPDEALSKLQALADLGVHSIEQPIRAKQWREMATLCRHSPLPIALDEELIGVTTDAQRRQLLENLQPQFLVLKPSLHGGFSGCEAWIALAKEYNIEWWVTSYLESNLGLNAIAQWLYPLLPQLHQGLGTGQLFTNNLPSPLVVRGEQLFYDTDQKFDLSLLKAIND